MKKVTSFQERTISQTCKVIAFLAFMIITQSWGVCRLYSSSVSCTGGNASCSGCTGEARYHTFTMRAEGDGTGCANGVVTLSCSGSNTGLVVPVSSRYHRSCVGSDYSADATFTFYVCSTECEAKEEQCSQDTSKVWDPDNCECVNKPPPMSNCNYCEGYTDVTNFPPKTMSRHYECTQCIVDSTGQIWYNPQSCTVTRNSEGTCEDNGDCPYGTVCNDSTPNVDCYATVGATVYLRDRKSGHVWACDADGNCQMALNKYAVGQCQDPNPLPNSSDSGGNSSNSGANSSSEEPTSSGTSGPWGLEQTLKENTAYAQKTAENTGDIANYTVTIMGKTSDIYNELIEHGITLNDIKDNTDDIKTNTGTTAINTGNIDNKLSRTNNLLDSINKKNWNPHIDVQPPEVTVNVQGDTNSVTVNVDTSRAPSEILNLLRNFFGSADTSSNYNPQDTAGAGDEETSMIDSIRAKVGSDTVPNMSDSIPNAVNGVRSKMRAFRDSVNNSAFGDSLTRWENQLLNNGVITGNGSDNCPSLFTRTFTWNMGQKLGTWNIGKFQFICEPISGVGVTLWQLARTLLRAIVAISCMIWLYRTVLGVEGSNDED